MEHLWKYLLGVIPAIVIVDVVYHKYYLKKFGIKELKDLGLALVIMSLIVAYYFFAYPSLPSAKVSDGVVTTSTVSRGKPTFEWSYKPFEKEGIPYTTISLTAKYQDGTSDTKQVDEIDGECNAYETLDADVYVGSTMIICYYAGFGRYYKVVESEGKYAMQRKEFEEGSPEYDPPVLPYETIANLD